MTDGFRGGQNIGGLPSSSWKPRRYWLRLRQTAPTVKVYGVGRLDEAVTSGIDAGNANQKAPEEIRLRAREFAKAVVLLAKLAAAISEVLTLIREYPRTEELQKIAARLILENREHEEALKAWQGLARRFPDSMDVFLKQVELTGRYKGSKAAAVIVRSRFPCMPTAVNELLTYAEACSIIGDKAESEAAFDRLRILFERRKNTWLRAASWLEGHQISPLGGKLLRWGAARLVLTRPIVRENDRLDTVLGLDSPRFGGHRRCFCARCPFYGQDPSPLCAGVPAANGRAGACRA